jgi:predicted GH43/DUF377 family glycosyl hydrolase
VSGLGPCIKRPMPALRPDPRRVLAKPYLPGEEIVTKGRSRAALLMNRIVDIPEDEVAVAVDRVMAEFAHRHRSFEQLLERHYQLVAHQLTPGTPLSRERRMLIGAYFTHEYSVEAAALFNPSLVIAPDQRNVPPGARRFVMSLRAVGEGHISSIEFRSGTFDATGEVTLEPAGSLLVGGERTPPSSYDRQQFAAKLVELGTGNDIAWSLLSSLPQHFTPDDLEQALSGMVEREGPTRAAISFETVKMIRVLAASSYQTRFPPDSDLGERVIFPAGPHETRGMEDARFVRFVDDDGSVTYYATYTAYDGFEIVPQLIETADFVSFAITTLHGAAAQNKGMALFPRRIDGKYVMLSRKDRENLHLTTSDDVRFWNDSVELHQPTRPWELVQIGNCGSPLETEAGWLVITHGVGPMRTYAIGALLLDLHDPRRVIAHLDEPLLTADETERDGYVPNVLYTCGGLIHGEVLVLPYAFADQGINIALVSVPELLAKLVRRAIRPAPSR